MLRLLAVGVFSLALPFAAAASAVVQSVQGPADAGGAPLLSGARVHPGTNIVTGPGAQVFLRFDDGMQVVLHEQSYLRLVDFRHTATGAEDRAVLHLIKGAARVATGRVATANPKGFFFRTPQAQFMVGPPADFTVALVNPAYVSVSQGTLYVSNGYGTSTLVAGSTASIASNAAAALAIPASSFPPVASAAMTNLAAVGVTPVAGGASAGAAVGAAAGTAFGVPAVAAGAAAFGLGIAAARSNSRSPVSHAPNH